MIFKDRNGNPDIASVAGAFIFLAGLYMLADMLIIWSSTFSLSILGLFISGLACIAILMVSGIGTILANNRSIQSRAAIAGTGLCLSFMIRNIGFIEIYGLETPIIISLASFIIGCCGLIASISLMFGYRHYAMRLLQCLAIMTVVELYPFYSLYNQYIPILSVVYMYYSVFLLMAAYITMIVLLMDKRLKVVPITKKVDDNLDSIKDVIYSGASSFITPESKDALTAFFRSGVPGKIDIMLQEDKEKRTIRISRTDEGGLCTLIVVPNNAKSPMNGFRMTMRYCTDTGEGIRIYGDDGVLIDVLVHDEPPNDGINAKISNRLSKKKTEEQEMS